MGAECESEVIVEKDSQKKYEFHCRLLVLLTKLRTWLGKELKDLKFVNEIENYHSSDNRKRKISSMQDGSEAFGKLPDHILVEIFTRIPVSEWAQLACVNKQWAGIFQGECFWQTAIVRRWPSAGPRKRWPGPIPRGSGRRRYTALYVSEHIISLHGEVDELAGHAFLFLKEHLELPAMSPPSSILHGTIIDQFISCGKCRETAHELASQIWLAVIDNLEENENTFSLLKRLAEEGEFFLPYPYSRSYKVMWRIFEKLFTDFRDCFSCREYFDILTFAESKFQPVPSTWLGF